MPFWENFSMRKVRTFRTVMQKCLFHIAYDFLPTWGTKNALFDPLVQKRYCFMTFTFRLLCYSII